MYTAFFGLQGLPFETRADARFFFAAPEHEEAIAAMQYEAQHGAGVGLILGEAGTGKTMAVRVLLSRLTEKEKAIVVTASHDGGTEILREVCQNFGVSVSSSTPDPRGLPRLRKALSRIVSEGRSPVLIIDQAEHLSPAALADIESLLDMEEGAAPLLRIILAAHVRFREVLEQPAYARLRQLAFTQRLLTRLSPLEIGQYVRHRLSVAGATDPEIFSDEALFQVAQRSNGIPRVINQVCNAAMVAAFGADETRVAARHVFEGPESLPPIDPFVPAFSKVLATDEIVAELECASVPQENDDCRTDYHSNSVVPHELGAMIQRAEQLSSTLQRRIPETTHVVDAAEQRIRQLLMDAREKCLALEARLTAETRRADQAMARLEQARLASARAEEIEARLNAFASQLTVQMDQVQARVAEMMQYSVPLDDARGRLEGTIRHADSVCGKVDESIDRGLERISKESDRATKAAQIAGEAADQARKVTESVQEAAAEGQRTVQSAREATDRFRSAQAKASEAAARLDADVASARHVSQDLTGLTALADQKIGQFSSLQAAASSLHERLGRMLTTAHPVVERTDEALVRLEQASKVTSQAASQLDRLRDERERAAEELKNIQIATQAAARQSHDLAALHDQTEEDRTSLQGLIDAAANWKTRMASLEATLGAAEQTACGLRDAVTSSSTLTSQFATLLERAEQERTALDEAIGSLKHLLEANADAQIHARETAERLDAFGQMFHSEVEAGRIKLEQYHEQIAEFEGQLEQVSARAADAVDVGSSLKAAVAEAHGQSENLERVCVAVRKVFAGLSQATLSAKGQAQEVEQFLAAANSTSASLRHWLERVRVRLSGMIDDSPGLHLFDDPTVPPAMTGMIAKEAHMAVEPGAAQAHLVDRSLEQAAASVYSSPAGEISQLIERARTLNDSELEAEWVGQSVD